MGSNMFRLLEIMLILFIFSACDGEMDTSYEDKTPPKLSRVYSESSHTSNNEILIKIEGEDIFEFYLTSEDRCLSGGEWLPFEGEVPWTVQNINGKNSVSVRVRDQNMNISPCINYEFVHDDVPPQLNSISINSGFSHTSNKRISMKFESVDADEAYITHVESCDEGGEWTVLEDKIFWELPLSDQEVHVFVKLRDRAGNESSCLSASVIHDSQAPTLSLSGMPANPSNDDRLNVNVVGADDLRDYQALLNKTSESKDCSSFELNEEGWVSVETPISLELPEDGLYLLCVVGRDQSGNMTGTFYEWEKGVYWELGINIKESGQSMAINLSDPSEVTVDWGDGSVSSSSSDIIFKTYDEPGQYNLKIKGKTGAINFNNEEAKLALSRINTQVKGIEGIQSFKNLFKDAINLIGPIPEDIFEKYPDAIDFSFAFSGNKIQEQIPERLFSKNKNAMYFSGVFSNSEFTGPIPENIFSENLNAELFDHAFADATYIKGPINPNLFSSNINATSFSGVFSGSGIDGVLPPTLFINNVNVVDFSQAFARTSELDSDIPEGLFSSNSMATNFSGVFSESSVTGMIPQILFSKTSVKDLSYAFYKASGLRDVVPEFWTSLPGVTASEGCFNGLDENITNNDDIPNSWK